MVEYAKIGVWQTAFLGDAVLTLPLLKALHLRFPRAEIHFFVRRGVESVFTAQPELAGIHAFDKRGAQKTLRSAVVYGREIARRGFDLWISAHTSPRSALLSRVTGIPRRIGYNAPWYNRLAYTETVDRCFGSLDEIERLFQLAAPLGIDLPAPKAELALVPGARESADAFWAEHCRDVPVLGIHPGSTWATKCWPVPYFAEVAAKAVANGVRVLVFGGPDETDVALDLIRQAGGGPGILNLAGKLTLPELASGLKRLDAYLTNDSGPMHLAWVQDVPLVALFGPTVRSLGFFPRGENSTVLETPLSCRPCGLHGHKKCPEGHHRCMRDLTPDMVWAALEPKLKP